MTRYEQYLERARREHGEKFDASDLDPRFIPHYNSGARLEVRTTWASGANEVNRGRVGATSGWRPAFLLVRRRSDTGSSQLLGARDEVVRVVAP